MRHNRNRVRRVRRRRARSDLSVSSNSIFSLVNRQFLSVDSVIPFRPTSDGESESDPVSPNEDVSPESLSPEGSKDAVKLPEPDLGQQHDDDVVNYSRSSEIASRRIRETLKSEMDLSWNERERCLRGILSLIESQMQEEKEQEQEYEGEEETEGEQENDEDQKPEKDQQEWGEEKREEEEEEGEVHQPIEGTKMRPRRGKRDQKAFHLLRRLRSKLASFPSSRADQERTFRVRADRDDLNRRRTGRGRGRGRRPYRGIGWRRTRKTLKKRAGKLMFPPAVWRDEEIVRSLESKATVIRNMIAEVSAERVGEKAFRDPRMKIRRVTRRFRIPLEGDSDFEVLVPSRGCWVEVVDEERKDSEEDSDSLWVEVVVVGTPFEKIKAELASISRQQEPPFSALWTTGCQVQGKVISFDLGRVLVRTQLKHDRPDEDLSLISLFFQTPKRRRSEIGFWRLIVHVPKNRVVKVTRHPRGLLRNIGNGINEELLKIGDFLDVKPSDDISVVEEFDAEDWRFDGSSVSILGFLPRLRPIAHHKLEYFRMSEVPEVPIHGISQSILPETENSREGEGILAHIFSFVHAVELFDTLVHVCVAFAKAARYSFLTRRFTLPETKKVFKLLCPRAPCFGCAGRLSEKLFVSLLQYQSDFDYGIACEAADVRRFSFGQEGIDEESPIHIPLNQSKLDSLSRRSGYSAFEPHSDYSGGGRGGEAYQTAFGSSEIEDVWKQEARLLDGGKPSYGPVRSSFPKARRRKRDVTCLLPTYFILRKFSSRVLLLDLIRNCPDPESWGEYIICKCPRDPFVVREVLRRFVGSDTEKAKGISTVVLALMCAEGSVETVKFVFERIETDEIASELAVSLFGLATNGQDLEVVRYLWENFFSGLWERFPREVLQLSAYAPAVFEYFCNECSVSLLEATGVLVSSIASHGFLVFVETARKLLSRLDVNFDWFASIQDYELLRKLAALARPSKGMLFLLTLSDPSCDAKEATQAYVALGDSPVSPIVARHCVFVSSMRHATLSLLSILLEDPLRRFLVDHSVFISVALCCNVDLEEEEEDMDFQFSPNRSPTWLRFPLPLRDCVQEWPEFVLRHTNEDLSLLVSHVRASCLNPELVSALCFTAISVVPHVVEKMNARNRGVFAKDDSFRQIYNAAIESRDSDLAIKLLSSCRDHVRSGFEGLDRGQKESPAVSDMLFMALRQKDEALLPVIEYLLRLMPSDIEVSAYHMDDQLPRVRDDDARVRRNDARRILRRISRLLGEFLGLDNVKLLDRFLGFFADPFSLFLSHDMLKPRRPISANTIRFLLSFGVNPADPRFSGFYLSIELGRSPESLLALMKSPEFATASCLFEGQRIAGAIASGFPYFANEHTHEVARAVLSDPRFDIEGKKIVLKSALGSLEIVKMLFDDHEVRTHFSKNPSDLCELLMHAVRFAPYQATPQAAVYLLSQIDAGELSCPLLDPRSLFTAIVSSQSLDVLKQILQMQNFLISIGGVPKDLIGRILDVKNADSDMALKRRIAAQLMEEANRNLKSSLSSSKTKEPSSSPEMPAVNCRSDGSPTLESVGQEDEDEGIAPLVVERRFGHLESRLNQIEEKVDSVLSLLRVLVSRQQKKEGDDA